MSEQRAVEAIIGNPKSSSEIFSNMDKDAKRARIAAVLSRGITNDRLKVDLPAGVYGEWVNRDPMEVLRMESIGFKIDTEYANKRALNGDGTGSAIIGDVVFMTAPSEVKEIIDEIRTEQFRITHGDPSIRQRRHQQGDTPNKIIPADDVDITGFKTIDESVETTIDGSELAAAIQAGTIQKKPS